MNILDNPASEARAALTARHEDRMSWHTAPRWLNAAPISDADLFIELIGAVGVNRMVDDELWIRYGQDFSDGRRNACRRERTCVLYDGHRGDCL